MLLDLISNLSKAMREDLERHEARLNELQMRPDDTIKSKEHAFHYFYGTKARSIWDHGLKSVDDLYLSGFAEDFFRPTRARLDGYPYVWFTSCDYVNATKLPDFMRHPRSRGRDQWGVGPGRVIVSQSGLKYFPRSDLGKVWYAHESRLKRLTNDLEYSVLQRTCLYEDYFTSDKPVPRSEFIRMEWFDLNTASWREIQFSDANLT